MTALEERLADNGDISGLAWMAQPRDYATFADRIDTTNQPRQPTQWVRDWKRFSTTDRPINGGTGTNESSTLVGEFTQAVLGMRANGVSIRVTSDGTRNNWQRGRQRQVSVAAMDGRVRASRCCPATV